MSRNKETRVQYMIKMEFLIGESKRGLFNKWCCGMIIYSFREKIN